MREDVFIKHHEMTVVITVHTISVCSVLNVFLTVYLTSNRHNQDIQTVLYRDYPALT